MTKLMKIGLVLLCVLAIAAVVGYWANSKGRAASPGKGKESVLFDGTSMAVQGGIATAAKVLTPYSLEHQMLDPEGVARLNALLGPPSSILRTKAGRLLVNESLTRSAAGRRILIAPTSSGWVCFEVDGVTGTCLPSLGGDVFWKVGTRTDRGESLRYVCGLMSSNVVAVEAVREDGTVGVGEFAAPVFYAEDRSPTQLSDYSYLRVRYANGDETTVHLN